MKVSAKNLNQLSQTEALTDQNDKLTALVRSKLENLSNCSRTEIYVTFTAIAVYGAGLVISDFAKKWFQK